MQRLIELAIRQAAQPYLGMGRSALVRGVTISALALVGAAFALAAAVMGLSWIMGPIAASGMLGLAFLSVAGLMAWRQHRHMPPEPIQSLVTAQRNTSVAELSFALGFVLSRVVLRKLAPQKK